MDMNDSPPISTPRDLSEIPIAIYDEENLSMDPFQDASSSELKPDNSCWSDSPSSFMEFSSRGYMQDSGIIAAPVTMKRKFAKKKLPKSKSPRRTSARISKVKAEVIETKEPVVVRTKMEPDLAVTSMEAYFEDPVSRRNAGTRQVDLDSKLTIRWIGASRKVLTRTRMDKTNRIRVCSSTWRFRRLLPHRNLESPREQQQRQRTR